MTGTRSVLLMMVLLVAAALPSLPSSAASAVPGSVSYSTVSLASPHPQKYGEFGQSVSIGTNVVAVGAYNETAGGYASAGHVYLFNARTGGLIATLASPNAQQNGEFGWSVAASGHVLVVGAPDESVGGVSEAGRAYLFNTGTRALIATLASPNPQKEESFGYSVAIGGSTAVVGAINKTVGGQQFAGGAYVFNVTARTVMATLTSPNPQEFGYYGWSVATSGSTVVVGAMAEMACSPPCDYGSYSGAGHVYVINAETGILLKTLTDPNAQAGSLFGSSVSDDGSTMAVGAWGETLLLAYDQVGAAYLFNAATGAPTIGVNPPLVRNHQNQLVEPEGANFGWAVGVEGGTVVVGAPGMQVGDSGDAGYAYILNVANGGHITTLVSPNPQSTGEFGSSLGISGDTIVVGAHGESAGGYSRAGHAYLFIGPPEISLPIELKVAGSGPSATAALSGCWVSSAKIAANGITHVVQAAASCTITVWLPSTNTARYSAGKSTAASTVYVSTLSIKTCPSGLCSTSSHTIYEQFCVAFKANPSAKGTTTPSGSEWYQAGLAVPIKANPKSGYHFSKWSSSTTSIKMANPSMATTTATIDGAGTITATFT